MTRKKTVVRILVVIALLLVGVVAFQPMAYQQLERWFGPPPADLKERYARDKIGGPQVDHSLLDTVLSRHVDAAGHVDYAALHRDRAALDRYTASLAKIDFEPLGRNEKLVLLINAYNAFTLVLILDHYPLASIRDIPKAQRWDAKRWRIGALTLSLAEIELEYLRNKFREPRIHFAINCASISCPPLRREAYAVARIEEQLDAQARLVHARPLWFGLDTANGVVSLTRLYMWYGSDFAAVAGTELDYAARYSPALAALVRADRRPTINWLEYDWGLNQAR